MWIATLSRTQRRKTSQIVQFHKLGPDGIKVVSVPNWLAALVGVGVMGLALTLLIVAASAALILLPILALAGLVYGWWMRRQIRKSGVSWPSGSDAGPRNGEIIEGEFVVIETKRNDAPGSDTADKGPAR